MVTNREQSSIIRTLAKRCFVGGKNAKKRSNLSQCWRMEGPGKGIAKGKAGKVTISLGNLAGMLSKWLPSMKKQAQE